MRSVFLKCGTEIAAAMVLADTHVKNLMKEGAAKAGQAPSTSEWRIAPEAVEAAKMKAEAYIRKLGEQAARNAASRKQSTLKASDVEESGHAMM
jgi:histone H3/H4